MLAGPGSPAARNHAEPDPLHWRPGFQRRAEKDLPGGRPALARQAHTSGRTNNLRALQPLPGHARLKSRVRPLGIEVDDATGIAEQTAIWPLCNAGRTAGHAMVGLFFWCEPGLALEFPTRCERL